MKMIKKRLKVTQTDYKNRKINCIFKMTNTMLATSENQRKYIFLDEIKILKSFFIKGFWFVRKPFSPSDTLKTRESRTSINILSNV